MQTGLIVAAIVLSAASLGLCAILLHKVSRLQLRGHAILRRINQLGQRDLADLLRQIQALDNLRRLMPDIEYLPPVGGYAASPDLLEILARLALQRKPKVIVECGSGVSTLVFARCAREAGEGHVYALEHDPTFAEKTRRDLAARGLDGWATVVDAPLKPYQHNGKTFNWYARDTIPEKIDMLVVDGPPVLSGPLARFPAGPVLFPELSRDAIVILDDTKRDDEREMIELWQKDFDLEEMAELPLQKGCIIFHPRTRGKAAA